MSDLESVRSRFPADLGDVSWEAALPSLLVAKLEASRTYFERTTSVLTAEHQGFRPAEGTYTVAQQVAHTACTVDWFTTGTFSPRGFDLEFDAVERWVARQDSLAAARRLLHEAFGRAIECFGTTDTAQILAPIAPGPVLGGKPRWLAVPGIEEHTAHHRGSLAVYARLLGLRPPVPYLEAEA